METIYDNTKKSILTDTTKENNQYYEPSIKTIRKPLIDSETCIKIGDEVTTTYKICTDDCISKKELISFLEDKIKNLESYAISFGLTIDKEIAQEIEIKRSVYKNVLDFVNKGGKDE